MNRWNILRKCIITTCLIFAILTLHVFATETTTMLEIIPNVKENEMFVAIKYTSNNMCGGSFNFVYDTTSLELIDVEEGTAIQGITHFINSEFADGVIRINWVSTTALAPEGVLADIKFRMLNQSFDKEDISIDKLKVADSEGRKQDAEYRIIFDIIEQDTTQTGNDVVNNYSPSLRPASGNSVMNQEHEEDKLEASIVFIDVKTTDWFYENVQYVVDNNLMNGVAEDEFAPNDTFTRAMLVTVLYRNAGEPAVNKSVPFVDVDMGSWYANAVIWAKQNGIVNGVNDTEFAPDASITREQIATIMFRYAQYQGMNVVTLEENLYFADADKISEYAVSSMNWAVGTGLMKGKSATTINPKDNASRAEMAAILQRFIERNK